MNAGPSGSSASVSIPVFFQINDVRDKSRQCATFSVKTQISKSY